MKASQNLIISLALTTLFLSCTVESKDISGSYELIKIEERTDTGWVTANWMKGGKGYLQYSSNGIMSVHFTPQNYETTGEGAYWYVAKYRYRDEEGIVNHTRILHSDKEEIGERVSRRVHLTGNRLFMYAEEYNFRLTWEKINQE